MSSVNGSLVRDTRDARDISDENDDLQLWESLSGYHYRPAKPSVARIDKAMT